MSFTKKNLQSSRRSMTFLKGATLFFLGMSCILFITKAFEITPVATDVRGYFRTLVLTLNGDNASATGIVLDGGNGDGTFNGTVTATTVNGTTVNGTTVNGTTVNGTTVNGTTISGTNIKGTTITGTTICLGAVCRTTWPTGGVSTSSESLWSTGSTGAIYYTSGNVGIGTTTPEYNLHVAGTGYIQQSLFVGGLVPNIIEKARLNVSRTGSEMIIIKNTNNSGFRGFSIAMSSNRFAIYQATGDSNTSNPERLSITSGGNVGIGTTGPQSTLHINGTTQFGDNLIAKSNTLDGILQSARHLLFYTSGSTEAMRITNVGHVGIGTQSPTAELEVVGDMKTLGIVEDMGIFTGNKPNPYFPRGVLTGLINTGLNTDSIWYLTCEAGTGFWIVGFTGGNTPASPYGYISIPQLSTGNTLTYHLRAGETFATVTKSGTTPWCNTLHVRKQEYGKSVPTGGFGAVYDLSGMINSEGLVNVDFNYTP